MSVTALIFLLGFIVGSFLALVRHPIYGLLVYVAVLYFDPTGHWWGRGPLESVRWEFLAAIVTFAAMLIHRGHLPRSPIFRSAAFWGFVTFVAWLALQSLWAIDPVSHQQFLTIWLKFLLVAIMICGCIDSWRHLRLFLWSQVVGCAYLGWLAFSMYSGGRFQDFASNALGEANYAALELVISLIVAGCLFVGGQWRTKVALLIPAALIADGVVTTFSRSGFLAGAVSLVAFNIFTPKARRGRVRILSALAVVLFLSLTTAGYWNRMQTIEYEGADVKGVDTGGGRLDIIRAQLQMFELHPLGCGSGCTAVLSPQFLGAQFLVGGQRASHNTFMTMLVEHGIPGALLYILLLVWTYSVLRKAARYNAAVRDEADGFPSMVLPALAAVMVAITVGDMFVQYPRLEARVWFVSLLITYVNLRAKDCASVKKPTEVAADSASAVLISS